MCLEAAVILIVCLLWPSYSVKRAQKLSSDQIHPLQWCLRIQQEQSWFKCSNQWCEFCVHICIIVWVCGEVLCQGWLDLLHSCFSACAWIYISLHLTLLFWLSIFNFSACPAFPMSSFFFFLSFFVSCKILFYLVLYLCFF